MTFQVALIGCDGWVLASDGRGTSEGANARRITFETQKIRYENNVASAPCDDECGQIARDQILEHLEPDPTKFADAAFHRELERFANKIWQSEYDLQCDGREESHKIRPARDRGITFMAVGCKAIYFLAIGKESNLTMSTTKCVSGDPGNASASFVECYYDSEFSISELAILGTHAVVQAARFNTGVFGLHALSWHDGDTGAKWLDSEAYMAQSQKLEREMYEVMVAAMQFTISYRSSDA
jgi:hypothetical protein